MAKQKFSYRDYLRQEFGDLIDQLQLTALQKRFIKGRWLDQVLWLEGRAEKDQKKYLRLRIITIVGGVIVPALVSLNNINNATLRNLIGWITFSTSLTVAISAAVEEFFQYGESYRRYRNTAEGMKIEGWSFFQLSGPYQDAKNHQEAYKTFAAHVETIIQKDVEGYNAEMMKKQEKQDKEGDDDDDDDTKVAAAYGSDKTPEKKSEKKSEKKAEPAKSESKSDSSDKEQPEQPEVSEAKA